MDHSPKGEWLGRHESIFRCNDFGGGEVGAVFKGFVFNQKMSRLILSRLISSLLSGLSSEPQFCSFCLTGVCVDVSPSGSLLSGS